MLGEHNITHKPKTFVKRQILADFLTEKLDDAMPDVSVAVGLQEPWTLSTDGSSCVDGSSAGLILTSPEGTEFTYALRFQFTASNNEAEHEALIASLRVAAQIGVRNVHVSVDSKLVANQVLGTFAHLSKKVLVEILKEKSIQEKVVVTVVEEDGPTWMKPIVKYLKNETLPDDRKEVSKLRIKARQYELLEGVLYRRSFRRPWLRCVGPLQADYVIREVHEGSCSMHAGPRSVVAKSMRLGYYWPTMYRDARDMIRKLKHPQSNGLVERANRSLGEGIKARLGEGNKNWVDELAHVLWAHRMMIKSSHEDTPLSLTYGNSDILEERSEPRSDTRSQGKKKMNKVCIHARVQGVSSGQEISSTVSNNARHADKLDGKLRSKWKDLTEVQRSTWGRSILLAVRAWKARTFGGH
ncbi:reverse transcriptase domain-containing protein [Tanacetum coccineum]